MFVRFTNSLTNLEAYATQADKDLKEPAVLAIIEFSCAYPGMTDQMEATCAGFGDAKELTDAIKELYIEPETKYWGKLSMFREVDWNADIFYNVFCNDTYDYKFNSQVFCEYNSWPEMQGCADCFDCTHQ